MVKDKRKPETPAEASPERDALAEVIAAIEGADQTRLLRAVTAAKKLLAES